VQMAPARSTPIGSPSRRSASTKRRGAALFGLVQMHDGPASCSGCTPAQHDTVHANAANTHLSLSVGLDVRIVLDLVLPPARKP
jgi:hypothetical protein